jgi:YihY family inner membrane protein
MKNIIQYLKKLGLEFLDYELSLRSAGISYYLFFTLIPIVTTLVSLVLLVPFLELNAENVVAHITSRFLPEAIYDIKTYFATFSENAGTICLVSMGVATYALAKTIHFFEESLNLFWHLDVNRSFSRVIKKALLLYFLATLGIGISMLLRNRGTLNFTVELFITIGLFLGFNRIIPAWTNKVHWKTLMPGSILCGSIWYLIKWGFTFYLDRFSKIDLSAVLGVIPLFLVWLQLSSYLLLLSAVLNREMHSFSTAKII